MFSVRLPQQVQENIVVAGWKGCILTPGVTGTYLIVREIVRQRSMWHGDTHQFKERHADILPAYQIIALSMIAGAALGIALEIVRYLARFRRRDYFTIPTEAA